MAFIKSKLVQKITFFQTAALAVATGLAALILVSVFNVTGFPLAFGIILAGITSLFIAAVLIGFKLKKRVEEIQKYSTHEFSPRVGSPFKDEHQDELDFLGTEMRMMSDAVRSQMNKARDERGQMAAILEQMNEGIVAVNKDCEVVFVNPAAEKIFEIVKTNKGQQSLLEMTRNPDIDGLMKAAIRGISQLAKEIALGFKGEKILRVQAIGLAQEQSAIRGILVLTDMTGVRRLERMRREFVANVSHELRTPLTSLRGFIETLLSGAYKQAEQSQIFLKMMEQDASRLTRLIDDLLELSRLESKKISLQLERLSIRDEIQSAIDLFRKMLDDKAIRLVDRLPEREEFWVRADRDQLRQVLINLISNAIKFNKKGGEILFDAEKQGLKICVKISDTGCGIPEDAIPRIFERFFRVDKARSRDLGGTGLGLSIAKHIIEGLGGEIFCQSKLNEGSEFSFTLPLSSPESDAKGIKTVEKEYRRGDL